MQKEGSRRRQPLKAIHAVPVPDFENQYRQFQMAMDKHKSSRLTTVVQPFTFDHTIQVNKCTVQCLILGQCDRWRAVFFLAITSSQGCNKWSTLCCPSGWQTVLSSCPRIWHSMVGHLVRYQHFSLFNLDKWESHDMMQVNNLICNAIFEGQEFMHYHEWAPIILLWHTWGTFAPKRPFLRVFM